MSGETLLEMVERLDASRIVSNERYQCRNCHFFGALDVHGRCARCGSDAVLSEALQ